MYEAFKVSEPINFSYVYSNILVKKLPKECLLQIPPINYNGKEYILYKLNPTCKTHREQKLPYSPEKYAISNLYWYESKNRNKKYPCIILEKYDGLKDEKPYNNYTIENLIYIKNGILHQKIGACSSLRFDVDISKREQDWKDLLNIYNEYHQIKSGTYERDPEAKIY